jgi:predicted nucleic-acid-binding protein
MPSAVDTNVLLRLMVDEGSDHVRRARSLLEAGKLFVSVSVLLETEWVLRSRYALPADMVNRLMTGLVGHPNVTVGNDAVVRRAIVAHGVGMDFADALHLYSAAECDDFLTFDKHLMRKSRMLSDTPIVRQP